MGNTLSKAVGHEMVRKYIFPERNALHGFSFQNITLIYSPTEKKRNNNCQFILDGVQAYRGRPGDPPPPAESVNQKKTTISPPPFCCQAPGVIQPYLAFICFQKRHNGLIRATILFPPTPTLPTIHPQDMFVKSIK